MSQRASRPRSHGCTGALAQPASAAASSNARLRRSFADQSVDFFFEYIDVLRFEADMACPHDAVAIDQIRRRHALEIERLCHVALPILQSRIRDRSFVQKCM